MNRHFRQFSDKTAFFGGGHKYRSPKTPFFTTLIFASGLEFRIMALGHLLGSAAHKLSPVQKPKDFAESSCYRRWAHAEKRGRRLFPKGPQTLSRETFKSTGRKPGHASSVSSHREVLTQNSLLKYLERFWTLPHSFPSLGSIWLGLPKELIFFKALSLKNSEKSLKRGSRGSRPRGRKTPKKSRK